LHPSAHHQCHNHTVIVPIVTQGNCKIDIESLLLNEKFNKTDFQRNCLFFQNGTILPTKKGDKQQRRREEYPLWPFSPSSISNNTKIQYLSELLKKGGLQYTFILNATFS
jgi:hypothetical protein